MLIISIAMYRYVALYGYALMAHDLRETKGMVYYSMHGAGSVVIGAEIWVPTQVVLYS